MMLGSGQHIEYQSLSSEQKQIRTLILYAGKARDPIRCDLRIVSLTDNPPYEALSYAWGDARVTAPIYVGGVQFNATANLERALRHLRGADSDLTLWVDAVCINQNDMDEKSQQVSLMGAIYRQCSQVRIWLGCDEDECNLEQSIRRVDSAVTDLSMQQDPFSILQSLANDEHILDWQCFQNGGAGQKVIYKANAAFERCWAGFMKTARSTWWTRMWTVQEMILPKAGVLTYDTWSVTLEDVTKCGTNYYKHIWDCCVHAPSILPAAVETELDETCAVFFSLHRDRNALAADEYFDIQEQHLTYGSRYCQNPRDKVYGLLAIIGNVADLDLWLTPNYSNSEQEVFYDATCAMLYREIHALKCLTGTQCGIGAEKWASWVRDFGAPMSQKDGDVGSNRLMIYDLFDASRRKKSYHQNLMAWPVLGDEKRYQVGLGLTGRKVGTVASVCAAIRGGISAASIQERKLVYQEWVRASGVNLDQFVDGHEHSIAVSRFWRTMLGGVMSAGRDNPEYSDWRKFTTEAMVWLQPFLSWIDGSLEDMEFALDRTLHIATEGRCYFRTEDGGQGLCYPSVQVGDKIWVVAGSKVPFALRRADLSDDAIAELRPREAYGVGVDGVFGPNANSEGNRAEYGYFALVGDCYYDGYMHGEAAEGITRSFVLV